MMPRRGSRRFFARQDKVVYEGVAVERRLPGTEIRSRDDDGSGLVRARRSAPALPGRVGGFASRARCPAPHGRAVGPLGQQGPNQRLLCRPGAESPDGGCSRPFAFIQDLGSTFGPAKVDLEGWRGYPVWADPATCTVSMNPLPYDGATFEDTRISEEARRFLADRLTRLTPQQMRDLFVGARFPEFEKHSKEARIPTRGWPRCRTRSGRSPSARPVRRAPPRRFHPPRSVHVDAVHCLSHPDAGDVPGARAPRGRPVREHRPARRGLRQVEDTRTGAPLDPPHIHRLPERLRDRLRADAAGVAREPGDELVHGVSSTGGARRHHPDRHRVVGNVGILLPSKWASGRRSPAVIAVAGVLLVLLVAWSVRIALWLGAGGQVIEHMDMPSR